MIARAIGGLLSHWKGATVAAVIVGSNLMAVQLIGLSYDRFDWSGFVGNYEPTATPTSTPTSTPTATPTATPTNTPLPDGAPCSDPDDCLSGNCVDDVCCDTECTGPNEICNLQGSVGTCTDVAAPAPATSRTGLLAAAAILLAIAAVALVRRRRSVS